MLARYCDMLLKKSVKNYDDHELDEMLNLAVFNVLIFKISVASIQVCFVYALTISDDHF